jgi:hypothetical protein
VPIFFLRCEAITFAVSSDTGTIYAIRKIRFPNLQRILFQTEDIGNPGLRISGNQQLSNNLYELFDFSALKTMTSSIAITQIFNVTQFSLPALERCLNINIEGDSLISQFSIQSLVENGVTNNIEIYNHSQLNNIVVPAAFNASANRTYNFSGNGLNRDCIETLVAALIAGGQTDGVLNIAGGTNWWGPSLEPNLNILRGLNWAITDND